MRELLLILIVVLGSSQAKACKCVPKSIEEQIKGADLIFSGTLTSYESHNDSTFFSFQVTKTWKGNKSTTNVISTTMSFCGSAFELNKEYIVFSLKNATYRCRINEQVGETPLVTILNYKLDSVFRNSLGASSQTELNKNEVYFLNSFSKNFDFSNKRVAFAKNEILIDKKIFFDNWNELGYDRIVILSSAEKDKSGGYDVVVVTNGQKDVTKKFRNRLVKNLKNKIG